MKHHTISVTVEGTAIRVVPETLTMSAVDEVSWAGTNSRRFTIAFDGPGPLASRELEHARAIARHRPQAKGRFKYSVISADDPNLVLDPVIIVEEPPTGQTP